MPHSIAARHAVALLLGASLAWIASPSGAQDGYRRPPQEIVDILEAPPLPWVVIDPTGTRMLLVDRQAMPVLADLSRPMLQLAGRRIDPGNNGPHGTPGNIGITLRSIEGGDDRRIGLPDDVRLSSISWSPGGERFAFTIVRPDAIELWTGDAESAAARRLVTGALNGLSGPYSWMPDGDLLVHFLPERGGAPEAPRVPAGPVIQESSGRASPVRTYQDLLRDAHDEALFDHCFTAQLAIVDAATGARRDIGGPAVYRQAEVSPDGRFLLVEQIVRPYSYMVPMSSFPYVVETVDLRDGSVRELARQPLAEDVPIEGVVTGPRGHGFSDVVGAASLTWTEALDGGDPKREAEHRDRVMLLEAPFEGEPREIARLEDRSRGLRWIEGTRLALVSEFDRDERWSRTWLVDAGGGAEPRLVFDRSSQDRYSDPGRPVTRANEAGRSVVALESGAIYLAGSGASPEGDRPFLDRMSLDALETTRLWRCEGACYESFVDLLPGGRILTRYETPDEPPNYWIRDLERGDRVAVTSFEHPAPQLRDVSKELVTYLRDDGVALSATLYLPPGYGGERPLPLIVWAYPREFNDPAMAGQVSGSPYRFTSIGGTSHLFLLLAGYAVMDGATMPIVGSDPETVNDTFLQQIVASAEAAIRFAAERGVADPERVGAGGHSYGAFMTANLLAHSDLFKAGVARSGAYNRTLTPFGFQSERRTYWEAPDVYHELSPFMHADRIDEPLLLIHGQNDNNSGTFPLQSERLYHAIKGHGGTARLVMLPYESHGYRAEESVMHVLAEMIDWFDRWVAGESSRAVEQ